MTVGEFRRMYACISDEADILIVAADKDGRDHLFEPTRFRLTQPLGGIIIETIGVAKSEFA